MWPACLAAASVTLDFSWRTTNVNLDRIYMDYINATVVYVVINFSDSDLVHAIYRVFRYTAFYI